MAQAQLHVGLVKHIGRGIHGSVIKSDLEILKITWVDGELCCRLPPSNGVVGEKMRWEIQGVQVVPGTWERREPSPEVD